MYPPASYYNAQVSSGSHTALPERPNKRTSSSQSPNYDETKRLRTVADYSSTSTAYTAVPCCDEHMCPSIMHYDNAHTTQWDVAPYPPQLMGVGPDNMRYNPVPTYAQDYQQASPIYTGGQGIDLSSSPPSFWPQTHGKPQYILPYIYSC